MALLLSVIKKNWITLTILFLSVISFLSLYPLEELPSLPGSDKTHHIIAYAILMLPAALRRPKNWKFISLFFIAYSGAIELLQPYVNRYGSWPDMAANTAGVVIGILLSELLMRWFPAVSYDGVKNGTTSNSQIKRC